MNSEPSIREAYPKISDYLPRLTIEPREARDPVTMSNLVIKLDGQEIKGLQGLTLRLAPDEVNEAEITLAVGEVSVDVSVVRWLEAQVGSDVVDEEG